MAEQVAVLELAHLANKFGTVGAQTSDDVFDVIDGEMTLRRRPSVFAGAFGSAVVATGVCNFVSSSRLWPSGVRIMAIYVGMAVRGPR